ncbi:Retrovirus-related Pol polyprotein from transposon RE2-like protein [Drosera capensis]
MDVKVAFLNGYLEEEVYIEQPLGYMKKGREDKVLRLRKARYGLKKAPRAYVKEKGYLQCPYKSTLYMKKKGEDILLVCLYVDDLIFT